ncbi:MAG: putative viral replication protein [Cressdnaviricota sp.]|nr:MAG: putative viral replication protein [Cressdnaviricota sp.]
MVETVENHSDDGNTNSHRISASKHWCLTFNNYSEDDLKEMVEKFKEFELKYIVGREIGEQGTPHLQGYISGKKVFRPSELKLSKKIHWEKRKKPEFNNLKYCSKDGDYVTNFEGIPKAVAAPKIYGWQIECRDKLNKDPDPRKIHWYWSAQGARGKSSMVKYLAIKHGALICSGKASDMKYMIVKQAETTGEYANLVVFDVPRSSAQYLSYTGIEEIKNGVFASTKYECSMVIMNHPHVVVFANFEPDMNDQDMSSDRFDVINVDDYTGGEDLSLAFANTPLLSDDEDDEKPSPLDVAFI